MLKVKHRVKGRLAEEKQKRGRAGKPGRAHLSRWRVTWSLESVAQGCSHNAHEGTVPLSLAPRTGAAARHKSLPALCQILG